MTVFFSNSDMLLVNCIVRLQDNDDSVVLAAGRCLQHIVAISCIDPAPATELLRRREGEAMPFEEFVFPFVALLHREARSQLTAQRLKICSTYLAALREWTSGDDENLATVHASHASTCIAAGFTAAALVRSIDERPSALVCSICRDLMDFMMVEEADFRIQVARILGFFDILAFKSSCTLRTWPR